MDDLLAQILENSDKVPNVLLKKGPDSSELILKNAAGTGRMLFYTLLPGMTLAFIWIDAPSWPEADENAGLKPLLLNYCISGRSELLLDDGAYIYLKDNDLAVSVQTAQREYIFPTGHYQGLKFYFDSKLLAKSCSEVLKAFELDLNKLEAAYCTMRKTSVLSVDEPAREILHGLWGLRNAPSLFQMKIDTFRLLHNLIENGRPHVGACRFYTRTQVELAKSVHHLLTANLSKHIPVRMLADSLAVSETSLKNYFKGVYGQNISAYLCHMRMQEAAHLLASSTWPVAEISEQVGYSNQGKFAAVFKKQFGLSPLEYRRASRLAAGKKKA